MHYLEVLQQYGAVRGINRPSSEGIKAISANDDLSAVMTWVRTVKMPTARQYEREAMRVMKWAWLDRRKGLSDLLLEDLQDYLKFLANPSPTAIWFREPGKEDPMEGPTFRRVPSPDSRRQMTIILKTMFRWLAAAGYLASDPSALIKLDPKPRRRIMERFLTEEIWSTVKRTIEKRRIITPRDEQHQVRDRWLVNLIYETGMRRDEVARAMMADLIPPDAKDHSWQLAIIGKGSKAATVPVSERLLVELRRYRSYHGLAPFPVFGEQYPLVLGIAGNDKGLSADVIYNRVLTIFEETALQYSADSAEAARLRAASTHWLRHSLATHMAKRAPLDVVRRMLRHEDLATTAIYVHTLDSEVVAALNMLANDDG